jgi:hypothetical protein
MTFRSSDAPTAMPAQFIRQNARPVTEITRM